LTLFRRELGQRFRQRFPQLPGHIVFDRVDGQRPLPAELLRSVVFGYLFLETSFRRLSSSRYRFVMIR